MICVHLCPQKENCFRSALGIVFFFSLWLKKKKKQKKPPQKKPQKTKQKNPLIRKCSHLLQTCLKLTRDSCIFLKWKAISCCNSAFSLHSKLPSSAGALDHFGSSICNSFSSIGMHPLQGIIFYCFSLSVSTICSDKAASPFVPPWKDRESHQGEIYSGRILWLWLQFPVV